MLSEDMRQLFEVPIAQPAASARFTNEESDQRYSTTGMPIVDRAAPAPWCPIALESFFVATTIGAQRIVVDDLQVIVNHVTERMKIPNDVLLSNYTTEVSQISFEISDPP